LNNKTTKGTENYCQRDPIKGITNTEEKKAVRLGPVDD